MRDWSPSWSPCRWCGRYWHHSSDGFGLGGVRVGLVLVVQWDRVGFGLELGRFDERLSLIQFIRCRCHWGCGQNQEPRNWFGQASVASLEASPWNQHWLNYCSHHVGFQQMRRAHSGTSPRTCQGGRRAHFQNALGAWSKDRWCWGCSSCRGPSGAQGKRERPSHFPGLAGLLTSTRLPHECWLWFHLPSYWALFMPHHCSIVAYLYTQPW